MTINDTSASWTQSFTGPQTGVYEPTAVGTFAFNVGFDASMAEYSGRGACPAARKSPGRTGLSKPTISDCAQRLLDSGLIAEDGIEMSTRGRPVPFYGINPDYGHVLGIEIQRAGSWPGAWISAVGC